MIINWPKHGVFWDGTEGSRVERLDDPEPSDQFEDDMQAAIFAAKNSDLPWVVYTEHDTSNLSGPSWSVALYSSEAKASFEVGYHMAFHNENPASPAAFCFDGRTQTPTNPTTEHGYRPPAEKEN